MATKIVTDRTFNVPFPIFCGFIWDFQINLFDDDHQALDLTGLTYHCEMRDDRNALICTPTIVVDGNSIIMSLSVAQTTDIGARELKYQIMQCEVNIVEEEEVIDLKTATLILQGTVPVVTQSTQPPVPETPE